MPSGIYVRKSRPSMYDVGTRHSTSQGVLVVLAVLERPYVLARFENTGYVTKARISNISQDKVKNHRLPSVYSVGYLDGVRIGPRGSPLRNMYDLWANMLKRCYCKHPQQYVGVTVDPRWHSFLQFMNSIQEVPGFTEWVKDTSMHLDKDIRVPGSRLYSASTCMFISASDNIKESLHRRWAKD